MNGFVLEFDQRPDNGPRLVGPFMSKESAFTHAQEIAARTPDQMVSYEARPLASISESGRDRGTVRIT